MDKTDKILVENRDFFEEEPKDGHFERFEARLRKSESKRNLFSLSHFLKYAAIIIIVLLSANLYVGIRNAKNSTNQKLTQNSDLGEASAYYTVKINTGINDLEKMATEGIGSKQEILQIKQELSAMDSLFMSLQQEYTANPNDERIINAMIEYYQTKLDIVNKIKTDLENIKQLKNKRHENPEI